MLSVENVRVSYGGIVALHGVDCEVREGQVVAVIGSNGAGKTSLMSAIAGLIKPSTGAITFDGVRISGTAAHRIARRGLILVPEGRRILSGLTVEQNLDMGRCARGNRPSAISWEKPDVFDLFPILGQRREQKAGSLSGGEQQMLAIGRGLMGHPRLLVLDEPSLGLAPIVCDRVFEALDVLKGAGLTMILVEQNATRALAIADYAYVLETGNVAKRGATAELAGDPDIIEMYLGAVDDAQLADPSAKSM